MTKTELDRRTKEAVHAMLDGNDKAVDRAVVAIYKRQTAAEQATDSTTEDNGVGFGGLDAEFLSSLAKSAIRFGSLTDKQRAHARKSIKKYWRQLADIAKANGRPIIVDQILDKVVQERITTKQLSDAMKERLAEKAEVQAAEAAEEERRMARKFGTVAPMGPLFYPDDEDARENYKQAMLNH